MLGPSPTKINELLSLELFWNPRIVRELVEFTRARDPYFVFIAKIWTDENRLDHVLHNLDFDQKWVVPRSSRGGSLTLFWKDLVNLVYL